MGGGGARKSRPPISMLSYSLKENIYGLTESIERTFQLEYIQNSRTFTEREISVSATTDELEQYLRNTISHPPVVYRSGRMVCGKSQDFLILCEETDRITQIRITGEPDTVNSIRSDFSKYFTPVPVQVRWVYNSKGDDVKLPIRTDNLPRLEFYPWLPDENLESYYGRFISSDSNVLVLIGPPGTGKTSFIRGLLYHTKSGATVSYDPGVLDSDEIFADFMSGPERFMILEDADTFLSSRSKSGNTVMHRFLNVGDGLISTRGKKIVFSTNLPSIRDIDEALLRPGRCFDVLQFSKLSPEQARVVRPEYDGESNTSLAELLNDRNDTGKSRRVGFV